MNPPWNEVILEEPQLRRAIADYLGKHSATCDDFVMKPGCITTRRGAPVKAVSIRLEKNETKTPPTK